MLHMWPYQQADSSRCHNLHILQVVQGHSYALSSGWLSALKLSVLACMQVSYEHAHASMGQAKATNGSSKGTQQQQQPQQLSQQQAGKKSAVQAAASSSSSSKASGVEFGAFVHVHGPPPGLHASTSSSSAQVEMVVLNAVTPTKQGAGMHQNAAVHASTPGAAHGAADAAMCGTSTSAGSCSAGRGVAAQRRESAATAARRATGTVASAPAVSIPAASTPHAPAWADEEEDKEHEDVSDYEGTYASEARAAGSTAGATSSHAGTAMKKSSQTDSSHASVDRTGQPLPLHKQRILAAAAERAASSAAGVGSQGATCGAAARIGGCDDDARPKLAMAALRRFLRPALANGQQQQQQAANDAASAAMSPYDAGASGCVARAAKAAGKATGQR